MPFLPITNAWWHPPTMGLFGFGKFRTKMEKADKYASSAHSTQKQRAFAPFLFAVLETHQFTCGTLTEEMHKTGVSTVPWRLFSPAKVVSSIGGNDGGLTLPSCIKRETSFSHITTNRHKHIRRHVPLTAISRNSTKILLMARLERICRSIVTGTSHVVVTRNRELIRKK